MKQLLLFFLLSISAVAQKSFLVKDSSTNEPIAYTSIFTENGTFKVNAEPDGSFIIPNEFLHEVFVFDAVGYETKQQLLTDIVLLEQKSEVLDEVVIVSMKQTKTLKVGQVKNSNFSYGANAEVQSWSFARFFPYEKSMEEIPFLKEVKFYLRSEQKESTYGIRFYETDKEGFPIKLLHDELIVGKAKKGTKISTTDLRDHKILVPENGVLVAFEWIRNKENYYETKSSYEGVGHLLKQYNPSLISIPTDNFKFTFKKNDNIDKTWVRMDKERSFSKKKDVTKPYSIISCKLTLTN